jgi:hypothetical protein
MNTNLTVSALTFTQSFSDKGGSERRETSRGATLPEIMTIKHQDAVDSASKRPITRSVLRFDRHVAMTDGSPSPVSAYVVVSAPKDAAVASADILAVIARIVSVLDDTSPNLDLGSAIFVNKEQ